MSLSKEQMTFFLEKINDILKHPQVYKMDNFIQHGNVSCLSHSIAVAYYSYVTALNLPFKVDFDSLIRGAMLHDFFLYDWHDKNKGVKWHGLKHPKIALENALKYFDLNKKEKDIILRHMWPLTIIPPKYLESYIVNAVDKSVSVIETFNLFKSKFFMINKKLAFRTAIR
ncbi:MAG TPA: phosphohydrolase [Clostridia bacterium]